MAACGDQVVDRLPRVSTGHQALADQHAVRPRLGVVDQVVRSAHPALGDPHDPVGEQLHLIADDYLWDGWDAGTETVFHQA